MAKFQNVFKEASRRMKNFQARGFIPSGSKYVFQDFVNEVSAENRGKTTQVLIQRMHIIKPMDQI
ncbi:hypothetical protein ACHLPM_14810 (plasmid) [Enterococcus faecalis]